jgi:putative membrane protein
MVTHAKLDTAPLGKKKRTIKEYIGIFLRGVAMGASDIVPGVSGGTIAFIFGIYEELIESIRKFGDPDFLQAAIRFHVKKLLRLMSWEFLLALGLGILTAIFTLSHYLEWLLVNKPTYLWSFFFGLVLASIFTVGKRIPSWTSALWGMLALGTILAFLLVGLVPAHTPETWWFMILSGAAASVALILPGISGSFILLLMGKYQYVVGAVNDRDFFILALIVVGAVLGLVTVAQLISRLFKNYHDLTVALLTGFMVGSLRKIWPWREAVAWLQDDAGNFILDGDGHRRVIVEALRLPDFASPEGVMQFVLALIFATIGVVLIILVDQVAKKNKEEETEAAG